MLSVLLPVLLAVASISVPSQKEANEPAPQLVQSLGFNCSTQFGVCPIAPQPIGSVCYCGQTPGFVVN